MNAIQHKIIGTTGVTLLTFIDEYKRTGTIGKETFVAFLVAFNTSSLPDVIEPATSPHHRAFFHSIAFGLGISFSVSKVYQWEPKNDLELWGRRILLTVGIAYLLHLLADMKTSMGLPII